MKDKKAQFFIILLPLIAFILFTLSLIMYQYNISFEDRLSEFAAFDRMNNLDLSTQNVIKNIFKSKSHVNININGLSVSINEQLPFSHAQLNDSLDSFKSYLESNFNFISLDVNQTKTSLPLYIKSHDILYYHPNVGNTINNISILSPSSTHLEGYDVTMHVSSTFNSVTCSTTSGSDKRFTVSIFASNNTVYQCGSTNLDFSGTNSMTVTMINGKTISIYVGQQGNLELIVPSSASDFNTDLTTSIFLADNYNKPEVVLPSGIININYPSFGISKRGDVKII